MPFEKREIIFSNDEVLAAIRQFYARSNQSFPAGTINNISVTRANDAEYQFAFDVTSGHNYRERLAIGGEKLGAALLLYCISRHIPIPAAAQKRMALADGQLALSFEYSGDLPLAKSAGIAR